MITDKLGSYGAARKDMGLRIEHRQHKWLNNRAENSHQPTRRRERIMKRFKSPRQVQKFLSIHDQVANLFHFPRNRLSGALPSRCTRASLWDLERNHKLPPCRITSANLECHFVARLIPLILTMPLHDLGLRVGFSFAARRAPDEPRGYARRLEDGQWKKTRVRRRRTPTSH